MTPYQRIVAAAKLGKGVRLSAAGVAQTAREWSRSVGQELKNTRAEWDRLSRENSFLQSPGQQP